MLVVILVIILTIILNIYIQSQLAIALARVTLALISLYRRLWDLNTGNTVRTFQGHTKDVYCRRFA